MFTPKHACQDKLILKKNPPSHLAPAGSLNFKIAFLQEPNSMVQ